MSEYDNTNTGILFKNDKDGNEKRPDYKGSINIEGKEYKLSAWIRTKKDGSGKFMSMKAEAKDQQTAPPKQKEAEVAPAVEDDDTDEIPF